jgi:transcriptional regulator with XRE-family HTH domain
MDTNEERIIRAMATEMRVEMARKGWKQQDLADRVGITRESMSRYLSGKKQMPMDTFLRAMAAFGVSPAELMFRAVDRAAQVEVQD